LIVTLAVVLAGRYDADALHAWGIGLLAVPVALAAENFAGADAGGRRRGLIGYPAIIPGASVGIGTIRFKRAADPGAGTRLVPPVRTQEILLACIDGADVTVVAVQMGTAAWFNRIRDSARPRLQVAPVVLRAWVTVVAVVIRTAAARRPFEDASAVGAGIRCARVVVVADNRINPAKPPVAAFDSAWVVVITLE